MCRALSLAAAVSLGPLPPALVTALILAPVLVNCSVRATLPWMFAASLYLLAMIVIVPVAILASMFGVLGLPVFARTLRYSFAPWRRSCSSPAP
jgi:hypothetical protein